MVQEAYVNGVSTGKVDRLVDRLGLQAMSKDTVSRLCRGLDEQVTVFCERPLRAPTRSCGWTPSGAGREAGGVGHKAL